MKYIIICLASFMLIMATGQAAAAKDVTVDGSILGENSREQAKQQVLTNDLLTLYGAKDSAELTYQIPAGASSAHQQLTLEYEASDLLISPSSLTAEIDGEPVKTVKLAGNAGKKTLKFALNKSQSSPGFHSLSLKFYGVVHEGVCVRQDSSGNWIKIYPDSRLNIGEKNESKGVALEHYPHPFAQSGSSVEKTTIVIPDHPSSAEIEAAVKTEAYLKTVDNSISTKILGESDLAKIDRPTIVIGAQHHWSGKVKKLLKQAKLEAKGDKLLLAERMLKAKDKQQPVLFAATASDAVLSEKISVITDKTYAAQLSGDTLAIGKLQQHNKRDGSKLTLEDFGAGDLTIGSGQTSSEHFYYPAPALLDKNQPAKLSLTVKKSETIQKQAGQNDLSAEQAELKVMINGQPHSVGLDDLGKEDKNGFYHVSLKVDPKLLQKNRYIDIQFSSSGLKENNPCYATNEDKWIFIDKQSALSYHVSNTSASADFQAWPLPYAGDQDNKTLMILPDNADQSKLDELSLVVDSFGSEARQAFTVKTSSEVKPDDVKGRNVIFIGSVDQFSLLKEKTAELAVPTAKNGTFDVSSFQMLNETTKQVAFTQTSLWDSNYSMAVFAPFKGQGTAVTKEMINFLNSNEFAATVVNETDSHQLFTNHQQLTAKSTETKTDDQKESNPQHMLYIVILIVIIAAAVILILTTARRRKRKAHAGERD
ncbi:cellulose biosynthesis cyclic di-GMP-binding regulatory protein BcsB [Bacillus haynesii]|uniref:cellulose biosynthesis cyclic di-GMP-binding regulatory protein BcsB n=1 Tax=Bacillus haynesii TaxID=1925021 RepID=UPI00227FD8A1|nr:cellulose biosynthesis cyclic di-GMP-binding regulatory protein BcsB [Bacillus haynesii]MCY8348359.1 cellulose biosynthesis cyclic di-GMP-binding regulatory protein BcsB [Bacillus haynesii]